MSKMKTTEQFIKDAKAVHGDKYDYSKVDYKGNKKDITIICPIHGEFEQRPQNHLYGFGCKKCSGKYKYSTNEWIELAKNVHGDKYDYSKVEYINNHTDVCIICPKHGEFKQLPTDHINGCGCKDCGNEKKSKDLTSNKFEFIEKAKKIHGDKYDYSKVEYVEAKKEVSIICPIHGVFPQKPNVHLNGHGCPFCNESKLEKEIEYFLSLKNIEYIKSHRFKWLGLQHLDFYLPKYNVAIECQGKQHYEPTSFGHNISEKKLQENLKSQQERDQRKKKLCEENGVKLLFFTHYKDVEEDNIKTFKDKEKLINSIIT